MISRRAFIIGLAAAAAAYPHPGAFGSWPPERSLNAYNVHTDESLDVTYYAGGSYDTEALEKINHLMRCHYTNEVKPIDIRVLDLLCDINDRIGNGKQIEIISGYRSPAYNEHLRMKSRKVVRDSFHLQGLAIDFSISGTGKETLSRLARTFYAGGVGKYREFVHIDVGPIRYW